jgi:secreted PhoX family phosphatase
MLNRRRFLQGIVAAAATPSFVSGCTEGRRASRNALLADPNGLLDLAPGLEYAIVSKYGDPMSDGLTVPGAHDGMAAFAAPHGRLAIVWNHELTSRLRMNSALADAYPMANSDLIEKFYDRGNGESPSPGGTTTTIYNPASRRVERQFLSLAGTETNCAGGATPWGSWLSCEECFEDPGTSWRFGPRHVRDERHGYVFEVPAAADGLVDPVPIKAMGRFEHEACAVHEETGIVYMTEDRHHSLFYRYIPEFPGELAKGGKLQALAVVGAPSLPTHNWGGIANVDPGQPLKTRWIQLDNVDPDKNDLRLRGAKLGAAMFARGEGLCVADDRFAFTCTIGGPARLGQVFTYKPSPYEGTSRETEEPGQLELIAEAGTNSLLHHCDNLTMAPWGDLVVCEDTSANCGLVGIRPDGSQYEIGSNPYSKSELAGVCFSPDGSIMFVNVQYPGTTLAITGDWRAFG